MKKSVNPTNRSVKLGALGPAPSKELRLEELALVSGAGTSWSGSYCDTADDCIEIIQSI